MQHCSHVPPPAHPDGFPATKQIVAVVARSSSAAGESGRKFVSFRPNAGLYHAWQCIRMCTRPRYSAGGGAPRRVGRVHKKACAGWIPRFNLDANGFLPSLPPLLHLYLEPTQTPPPHPPRKCAGPTRDGVGSRAGSARPHPDGTFGLGDGGAHRDNAVVLDVRLHRLPTGQDQPRVVMLDHALCNRAQAIQGPCRHCGTGALSCTSRHPTVRNCMTSSPLTGGSSVRQGQSASTPLPAT